MNLRLLSLSVVLLLAGFLLLPGERAGACAVAPHHNQAVQIATESAIIIWDEASKTEHFIRRASFSTEAADFGFLVPTPTKPTLAEASDEAFKTLATLTAPRTVTAPRPSNSPGCSCMPAGKSPGEAAPNAPTVRVLDEQTVAGHHAVVLEADDARALSIWLKEHDYDFSPALTDWVAPYIKAGWKITAFKIAKEPGKDTSKASALATGAVRMTFHTDRPFFPYREPVTQTPTRQGPPGSRLLRVFFVSDSRVSGTLGQEGKHWPGRAVWSNHLKVPDRQKLFELAKLPAETLPAAGWLTEFEDDSSPRPGTADVYFARSEIQNPVERPPHVQYVSSSVPGCVMCYALGVYLLVPGLIRYRRRRQWSQDRPSDPRSNADSSGRTGRGSDGGRSG